MFFKSCAMSCLVLIAGAVSGIGFAAEDEEPDAKHPFSFKLIDEDGKPVEGATAGVTAYFGKDTLTTIPTDDGTGWRYWLGTKSDADGIVRFLDGGDLGHLCVVARHPTRSLAGVLKIEPEKLDPAKKTDLIVVPMRPGCLVTGKFTCRDLTDLNRPIGWTNGYLISEGGRALGCSSEDQKFQFFAPPGDYVLESYGSNLYFVKTRVQVKPGQRELDLGSIEMPATQLALLVGKPAPELTEIECWKNSPGLKLADLKGKCVILDFWGYWCGPCVYRMPELFKLHAKYRDQGLEIVGIHVDTGEYEEEPVNTVEKLDRRLADIRKDVWKGEDVPYPVALIIGKPTSNGTAIETREARSPMAALYGVMQYPTLILIDPQGKVVGRFNPSRAEDIARLEELLKVQ